MTKRYTDKVSFTFTRYGPDERHVLCLSWQRLFTYDRFIGPGNFNFNDVDLRAPKS